MTAVERLGDNLAPLLARFLNGAKEDVQTFGRAIAEDVIRAGKSGDKKLTGQLLDQAKALLEVNRVRAVKGGWDGVRVVINTAVSTVEALVNKPTDLEIKDAEEE